MPLTSEIATDGLKDMIGSLSNLLSESGAEGAKAIRNALKEAAQPIYDQMYANAGTNPKPVSGALRNAIAIGEPKKRGSGFAVTVGVHASATGAYYANPVEYGHGGPHPAPPHPFVRPAYDARKEEAYEKLKQGLSAALDALGR